jgi:hypothetical protein
LKNAVTRLTKFSAWIAGILSGRNNNPGTAGRQAHAARPTTSLLATSATLIICGLLSGGCAKSIAVSSEFPQPVLEPYPLHVGVRYPAELTDFTHVENPLLQPEWTIRLGAANQRMFRALFSGMFTQVTELTPGSTGAEGNASIDLIIEPKLEDLEFTVPSQSSTDQYVVWLRYNLKLLQPSGQLLGDWRVTGYGQEDQGDFGLGSKTAMKEAAVTALRDSATNIVLGFEKAPGIATYVLTDSDAEASTNNDIIAEQLEPGLESQPDSAAGP